MRSAALYIVEPSQAMDTFETPHRRNSIETNTALSHPNFYTVKGAMPALLPGIYLRKQRW